MIYEILLDWIMSFKMTDTIWWDLAVFGELKQKQKQRKQDAVLHNPVMA